MLQEGLLYKAGVRKTRCLWDDIFTETPHIMSNKGKILKTYKKHFKNAFIFEEEIEINKL